MCPPRNVPRVNFLTNDDCKQARSQGVPREGSCPPKITRKKNKIFSVFSILFWQGIRTLSGRKRRRSKCKGKKYQLASVFKDNEVVMLHQKHIMTVLDIILLFLAHQELAFRGDDESTRSLNRGSFLELFDFICKYDPTVKERFDKCLPTRS